MKYFIPTCVLVFVVGSAVWGGYFVGYKRGYHSSLILQSGTFVVSLDALNKIRAGDITGGTERIESICFSTANTVYGNFVLRHDFPGQFVGNNMFDDLVHYRLTYRSNSAAWTPMERSLERNLSTWKSR